MNYEGFQRKEKRMKGLKTTWISFVAKYVHCFINFRQLSGIDVLPFWMKNVFLKTHVVLNNE